MINNVPLGVTVDHRLIMLWAERHRVRPAQPEGEERPWPLLFEHGIPGAGLTEIGWKKFFAEFERANLAFVFRDTKPEGDLDDTHEFVTRGAVPELIRSRRTTIVEPAI